jgi:hypothetical protein
MSEQERINLRLECLRFAHEQNKETGSGSVEKTMGAAALFYLFVAGDVDPAKVIESSKK